MDNELDYLKVDMSEAEKEDKKRKFMDNLKEYPELLENFSNERLEKILKYYQNENEEKRKRIEKKKAMLA